MFFIQPVVCTLIGFEKEFSACNTIEVCFFYSKQTRSTFFASSSCRMVLLRMGGFLLPKLSADWIETSWARANSQILAHHRVLSQSSTAGWRWMRCCLIWLRILSIWSMWDVRWFTFYSESSQPGSFQYTHRTSRHLQVQVQGSANFSQCV